MFMKNVSNFNIISSCMHKTNTLTLLEIDTVIMYDNVGIKYI